MGKKNKGAMLEVEGGGGHGDQQTDTASRPCKKHRKQKKSKDTDPMDAIQNPPEPLQLSDSSKKKKMKRKSDEENIPQHDILPSKKLKANNNEKNPVYHNTSTQEELTCDSDAGVNDKKSRKLKDTVMNGESESDNLPAQTKKKKKLDSVNPADSEVVTAVEESVKSKKKKEKGKKVYTENEESLKPQTTHETASQDLVKKKKKHKKRKNDIEEDTDPVEGDSNCTTPTKKKKKHDSRLEEETNTSESPVETASITSKVKGKKSKHKSKDVEERDISVSHVETAVNNSQVKTKKKKCKNEDSDQADTSLCPVDSDQDSSKIKSNKKKHKKEKSKNSEDCAREAEPSLVENLLSEKTKKAKKHKKNKTEKELDGGESIHDKDHMNSAEGESSPQRKDKKKKHKENSTVDSKAGNNDSYKDPARNKSSKTGLGTDIMNNSSEVHSVVQPEPQPQPMVVGQWSTEMFESSERQNKFLRLMGGLKKAAALGNSGTNPVMAGQPAKKGLYGSLVPSVGGQRALTHNKAQEMNQRLEFDYERALGFRGQRGVGLGFTPDPAEGKKFHIDINKSASKKFDD